MVIAARCRVLSAVGVLAAMTAAGAPAAGATVVVQPTCGSVITTNVKLTGDLTCDSDGLIVDGAGTVTIDLNGFTIRGGGTGTGISVRNSTAVRVRRGAIDAFRTGVVTSSPAELTDLTFYGNTDLGQPGRGSASDLIATAPIVAKRLTGTGSALAGFHTGSAFTDVKFPTFTTQVLRDSTLSQSELDTVYVFNSSDIQVSRNSLGRLSGLESDRLKVVGNELTAMGAGRSRGMTVSNNHFHNGTGFSLAPFGPAPSIVRDNLFEANGAGLFVSNYEGAATTITGNRFRNNGDVGLYVDAINGQVSISDNTFGANGATSTMVDRLGSKVDDGLHVVATGSAVVTVSGNEGTRNTDLGIDAVGVVDGGGNTARRNGNLAQCRGVVCS